ncbi:MAG: hypothetical protein JXA74_17185 [Anaerolineae bacterium]|nr:hypothetical protein [Anaerolineae bacterium]
MASIVGSGLESYIKRNARERALNRIAEAEKEAQEILDRVHQRVQLISEESQRNTEAKIDATHRRMMAQAELEAQAIRIRRREAVLNEVWAAARRRLEEVSDEGERLEILAELVQDAAAQLKGGDLTVQVNERDRALLDDAWMDALAESLRERQGVGELRLMAEPAPILGGAIVWRDDSRRVVDNSWDERLQVAREVLRDEVYRRLEAATEEMAPTGDASASTDAG